MTHHVRNRDWLLDRLRAEIVGPDPSGEPEAVPLPLEAEMTWEQVRQPRKQSNGEEILWQDGPTRRYGAGILFPRATTDSSHIAAQADSTSEELNSDTDIGEVPEISTKADGEETEELEVSLANAHRPAAMGLSLLADMDSIDPSGVVIHVRFAQYRKHPIFAVKDNRRTALSFWYRIPGVIEGKPPAVVFSKTEILESTVPLSRKVDGSQDGLNIVMVARRVHQQPETIRLLTVSLVNANQSDGSLDERSFFQCGFQIEAHVSSRWILPYPEVRRDQPDPEEEELRLLYRHRQTYAVGHGCSADWHDDNGRASCARTEVLPAFELLPVSTDLLNEDGKPLRVSMAKLAGLVAGDDGSSEIDSLLAAYESWILNLEHQLLALPEDLHTTASRLISRCRLCLARAKDGWSFVRNGSTGANRSVVSTAFRLTNEVMYLQRAHTASGVRKATWDHEQQRLVFDTKSTAQSTSEPHWRAFQIAFLLMTVRGICEPGYKDREVVDLIWFPTGGGKTEAYLGLTAFTLLFNRLSNRDAAGVGVLMRYTLRLLTTQQFERAGLLFCALEHVRNERRDAGLGEKAFRLGMWVGGEATPNTREDAVAAFNELSRDPTAENKFVLLKCPWCSAQMGPLSEANASGGRRRAGQRQHGGLRQPTVIGYDMPPRHHFRFRCPDASCEFSLAQGRELPISVVDEDIYDRPPDLLIGTVDKFALITWKPRTRAIFGIGQDGTRVGPPPALVIQDELHLISGPLGSMVGAYETAIEALCTDNDGLRPKIVASTATISRAVDQIRALYAREEACLFPPAGLSASDSFFAREDKSGRGRLYAGVMTPGFGSLQTTQARVFASLLQNAQLLQTPAERDPWYTLLIFFNSLRELGGAASLLVADSREYLRTILDRHGVPYASIRKLLKVAELTSRIRNDEIPRMIRELETPLPEDTVEACLASNIIEVGVDIPRLGLMAIVGQPKTTSQYIQVSSRVGRRQDCPGLVVVLYNQNKPRDRSHYERFRSYHERVYAHVEPTSVTPFSPPAVDRALHALIAALARNSNPESSEARPCPVSNGSSIRDRIVRTIKERVSIVDPSEEQAVLRKLDERFAQWQAWNPALYGTFGSPPNDPPLMHPAGSQSPSRWNNHSWPTLGSLRDVDANCEAEITHHYNEVQLGNTDES